MTYLVYALLGYLSGSVLYSYYLPLWFKRIDVTADTADGNPGAFNCIAKAGWPIGLLALVCDFLKGALPVLAASHILDTNRWAFALVIAAPVAGHAWPLFRRFRGGKAITVSFGAAAGLLPLWEPVAVLGACYLFFSLVVRLDPHRFRSIVTYLVFSLGVLSRLGFLPVTLGCLLMSAIVTVKHCTSREEAEKPTIRFALHRQE